MVDGISEKINSNINLSEKLVSKKKELSKIQEVSYKETKDNDYTSDNSLNLNSNNKNLINKLKSSDFHVKNFNFDLLKEKQSIEIAGKSKSIHSSLEKFMNKSKEAGKSPEDVFYSILKKLDLDNNPLTMGKTKILLEAKNYVKDSEKLNQINNSIKNTIEKYGNEYLKTLL